ncbi:DUF952 domain-containing protein [Pendulispora albinea]|uniref:DUF952 domain-containing protein n=1 Tax=Pendulispora albinea TaxID=2741071 RepID=A0ABZ2LMZ1_9BACT
MQWLFHILPRADWNAFRAANASAYAPPSLATEGFLHTSYRDKVAESARLYFAPDADLLILRIDPRKLDVPVDIAKTRRGPMPHIRGPIPGAAVCAVVTLADLPGEPDVLDPSEPPSSDSAPT